jgi:hypothetical protein
LFTITEKRSEDVANESYPRFSMVSATTSLLGLVKVAEYSMTMKGLNACPGAGAAT